MQAPTQRPAQTFPQLLLKHAAERPQAPAMREKEYGIWQTQTWASLARLVERLQARRDGLNSKVTRFCFVSTTQSD